MALKTFTERGGTRGDFDPKTEAVRLYREGMSTRDVARTLGLGKSSVPRLLREAGVNPRPRVDTADDATISRAVALYQQGKTSPEIAAELGAATPTVGHWLRTRGVSIRTPKERHRDPVTVNAAVDSYKRGESLQAIASRLGVWKTTVAGWLRDAGVERRKAADRFSNEQVDRWAEAYASGEPAASIAKKEGISPSVVRRHLTERGVPLRSVLESQRLRRQQGK